MVRAAWQRLRKQYLQLHADQTAGQTVNWSTLAESFLDMNMALEATMVAATRPTPLAD
ncbi:hypothetical protein [Rhizobacter sp. Root404]|uniref:hypothetical protein n=1 Tax=Rhizobacter sp. Root404 TaxID=1736528 RepID=UPI00138F7782|nr:hypothetical protein [Rhizobacter sp. Root404]